jgi:hypothetical protein
MLIRDATLERIVRGEVTLAFRRWIRPTVKAGGTLRTARGVLAIVSVAKVEERDIRAADARRAGYASRDELLAELASGRPGWLYRIELAPAGPDPRIVLRARRVGSDGERAELRQALARLDRAARDGAWTSRVLEELRRRPGVRAAELARRLGMETLLFKRRVRRLKELGLTESLETGYRLSPRGVDALAQS